MLALLMENYSIEIVFLYFKPDLPFLLNTPYSCPHNASSKLPEKGQFWNNPVSFVDSVRSNGGEENIPFKQLLPLPAFLAT